MKRFLICLLLCLFAAVSAMAQTLDTYTLSPAEVNVEAMKELAFGKDKDKARADTSREELFMDLGVGGPPFIGVNNIHYVPQSDISIVRAPDNKAPHEEGIWENVEPSGVARTKITGDEAIKQAEDILARLGFTDYVLQSNVAYGRLEFTAPSYKVAFGQAIQGAPLYWAAPAGGVENGDVDSNRALLTIDDAGLYYLEMMWCKATPMGNPQEALPLENALEIFHASGMQADTAEICYLVRPENGRYTATPAWRYRNSFIHAVTGEWMQ